MQAAFFSADKDHSGFLDENEIYQAISSSGFPISLPTIHALCQKFDTTKRGAFDFPTFLFMVAHLAHVRSIFEVRLDYLSS